jgi:esterase
MKLHYREVGDPTAPPIVILHGIFGSSDNWLTVAKTIAERGYRVILPDQRNHGQSPRSDEFGYVDMAADLHELITDLQLEQPVLVGHSMGGKTMMQYAMTYRNSGSMGTFRRLVVVDIAPKFYPVHHADILRGLSAIDLAALRTRAEADTILSQYEPSPTVRQFLLKNLYRTDVGGTLSFAWRLNLPVITRNIHGVGDELTDTYPVNAPMLFIRGSESPYILDSDWPGILRLFPQAQLITIEGAGHWVQAEKPAEFVAALMSFVKDE